jgi:glycosyltransferase involved in cell wall biosynthesis
MRVTLIGDYSGPPDEGMKNVARYFSRGLRENDVSVQELNINNVSSLHFYTTLRQFNPDVVHYIPGIGWRNLLLCRLLGTITGAKTVISAIHPDVSAVPTGLLRWFGPSLVFTQSDELRETILATGIPAVTLQNGVDLDRFGPLADGGVRTTRDRFNIPQSAFVALHVGHLTRRRNLEPLIELQRSGVHVVIAASDHFEAESTVVRDLRSAGVTIVDEYVSDIERLYGAADCYVFPTPRGETIQMPLSVLEAMACNLPIVSVDHPGLKQAFDPGDGLVFVESDAEIVEHVLELAASNIDSGTRGKARQFSWKRIANRAIDEYRALLES